MISALISIGSFVIGVWVVLVAIAFLINVIQLFWKPILTIIGIFTVIGFVLAANGV